MTKAVGDWIGVRGIADEMIKFNGYPFLEDGDHALNIPGMSSSIQRTEIDNRAPVSRVMRRELFTMPEAGTLSDVGELSTLVVSVIVADPTYQRPD